jgi:hypothetical protein
MTRALAVGAGASEHLDLSFSPTTVIEYLPILVEVSYHCLRRRTNERRL